MACRCQAGQRVLLLAIISLAATLAPTTPGAAELIGTAVGTGGVITHTSDGGTHWSLQTSGTTMGLAGVSFTDASNGWVVGDSGTILHTSDGGLHWAAQTSGVVSAL